MHPAPTDRLGPVAGRDVAARFGRHRPSTKEPFTYKDPCVELNPHVGFDPTATEAAKNAVKQYVKAVFKL